MIEKYLFEELNYSQSDIESENILKKVYSNFNNNDFLTYYKKIKSEWYIWSMIYIYYDNNDMNVHLIIKNINISIKWMDNIHVHEILKI